MKNKNLIRFEGMFILFLLFGLTLGLGILVSLRLYEFLKTKAIEIEPILPWEFLRDFLLAMAMVLAIFLVGKRFEKGRKYLLKALFLMASGLGSLIALGTLIGDWALVFVLGLSILWLARPNVLVQDIMVVLGMAGTGSLLGTRLTPETVVLLLVVFSIYDYIAVYKTKHMVKMAKAMIEEGAILGLVLPQDLKGFGASLKRVRPGKEFFVLGGGDVVFPLLLCSSVLAGGLTRALMVAFFAGLGLFFSLFVFARQESRRPIPALPPIALFSIIGYVLTLFL